MFSPSSLSQMLEKTISSDNAELEIARQFFEQAQLSPTQFLLGLSEVLANTSYSQVARMAAGLQLKNSLTSNQCQVKELLQRKWFLYPENIRRLIKRNVLICMENESIQQSSAAQCVACIAVIELPLNQWKDVISVLCSNVTNAASKDSVKETNLKAIGYIINDINHECISAYSNEILTAIVHVMKSDLFNCNVKLAAATTLLSSLFFIIAEFEKEGVRIPLLSAICKTTQCSDDTEIRVAALKCLHEVILLYGEYVEPYMAQAIIPIALDAIRSDNEGIAVCGIYLITCSLVLDNILDQAALLHSLVHLLIQIFTKQEDVVNEFEWNLDKSAAECLWVLASNRTEEVAPHILKFVKDNLKHTDWRYRNASLMALACILDYLKPDTLNSFVQPAMPTIIELLYDTSVAVRESAAYIICFVGQLMPDLVINEAYLPTLSTALITGLAAEPQVAIKICGVIIELATFSCIALDKGHVPTYWFSKYFDIFVEKLIENVNREGAAEVSLRSAATKAIGALIFCQPDEWKTIQWIGMNPEMCKIIEEEYLNSDWGGAFYFEKIGLYETDWLHWRC